MGGVLYLLLIVLIGASLSDGKAIDTEVKETSDVQLFFQYNKTLVHVIVSQDGKAKKSIIINEEVTDYAVDELNDRIFWVSKNGSIFVKSIIKPISNQLIFPPFDNKTKIDYDMITDKLYFTDHYSNIYALDLKYSNSSYYRWHVIIKNDNRGIEKIILEPEMGWIYVYYNEESIPTLYRYNMDGTEENMIELFYDNFYVDFKTKKFDIYIGEAAIDGDQKYWITVYTDDIKHNFIKSKNLNPQQNPKNEWKNFFNLEDFIVKDVKNLKVYRQAVKKLKYKKLINPCDGKNYGGCGEHSMCLLTSSAYRKSCKDFSKKEKHRRIARQIPFDMYSQQPTLRPEPQPTAPDNSYLPVYLSIIGK